VADHASTALRESRIEEVVVARPAAARPGGRSRAPSCASWAGLGRRATAGRPGGDRARPAVASWLADDGTFTARKNVELLREFAAREPRTGAPRADRAALPALAGRDPRRGRVEAIDVRRNEIVQADDGRSGRARGRRRRDDRVRPRPALGRLPGRPAARRAVRRAQLHPAERPRPGADADGEPLPASTPSAGSSAARPGSSAPTSATPRRPCPRLAEDLGAGALPGAAEPRREQIDALLAERKPDVVTVEAWRAIDAQELEAGLRQERPRVKLASREELLAAAGAGT
jgi:ferredoxin--NADP+ reductase